ncbi:HK97 family phage prohead protease [Prevotella koreensis]
MAKNKEIRNVQNFIKRSNENSRLIEGIAVVFNSDSQDLGFIESIDPSAITLETIKESDIFATLDHDKSRGILARSRYGTGTLNLELKDDGLYYSFEAPRTQLGDELLEYLSRREITTSSFTFTVDQNDGDEWYRDENGQLRRKIKKIYRLYDISPVFEPAYLDTDCSKRKFEDISNIDIKLDELKKEFENI